MRNLFFSNIKKIFSSKAAVAAQPEKVVSMREIIICKDLFQGDSPLSEEYEMLYNQLFSYFFKKNRIRKANTVSLAESFIRENNGQNQILIFLSRAMAQRANTIINQYPALKIIIFSNMPDVKPITTMGKDNRIYLIKRTKDPNFLARAEDVIKAT